MRAWRVHGPGDTRLDVVPRPVPAAPDDVQVRIEAAGICGTDLWVHEHAPVPADYRHPLVGTAGPHVLGHEMAGTVTATGPAARLPVGSLVAVRPLLACGTCSTCRRCEPNLCEQRAFLGIHGGGGAFAEYVVVAADQLHPLPPPFTARTGALVETLATCWHAVSAVEVAPDDVVLVVGAGPVGLGLVLCLRARGVRQVLVSARDGVRAEAATALGARRLDPAQGPLHRLVRPATGGAGVAVSYDAAGAAGPVVDQQVRALRPGGHLVAVAEFHDAPTVDLTRLVREGKHLHGSAAYTPSDVDAVVGAVAAGLLDPSPLVTSTLALEDLLVGGLHHLSSGGRSRDVKVLVTAAGPAVTPR